MFPFAATAMPFGVLRAALDSRLQVAVESGRARAGERDDLAGVAIDPADPVAPRVGDVQVAVAVRWPPPLANRCANRRTGPADRRNR